METAKIKIKKKGNGEFKKELKVGRKKISIPKEFVFSEEYSGECDIELADNILVKIIIGGKEVVKSDDVIQEKQNKLIAKQKKDEEAAMRQEEEKQRQQSSRTDSFDLKKAFAPQDTLSQSIIDPDNFLLKLNKLARFDEDDGKWGKFNFQKTEKKNKIPIKVNFGNLDFKQIAQKQYNAANASSFEAIQLVNMQTNWRTAVGLGHESVYETSITLHHVYGIPYIPASSIKGVVRSWIITDKYLPKFEGQDKAGEKAEKAALQNVTFCDFFGCPADSGKKMNDKATAFEGELIFYDAFPLSKPTIEPDIMNNHYNDYYGAGKNNWPSDDQSPNPIFFLTVKETSFQFIIGARVEGGLSKKIADKTAFEWLKEALTNHGIGAKTAVGYGYMKEGVS